MNGTNTTTQDVLFRPATAARNGRVKRLCAIFWVAGATGLLGAMAIYVFRQTALSPPWVSQRMLAGLVVVSGGLTKLLVDQLSASVAAFIGSVVAGSFILAGFYAAPYFLLDIGTLGGYALLPVIGDAITFAIFGQFPLQITGYLLVVVYDGMWA